MLQKSIDSREELNLWLKLICIMGGYFYLVLVHMESYLSENVEAFVFNESFVLLSYD